MASSTVPVQGMQPSGEEVEMRDVEGGAQVSAEKSEVQSSNFCMAYFQRERDGLEDFYRHWPREYTGIEKGVLKNWNLFIVRVVLGLASIGILFWSIAINSKDGDINYWMIFLTNWILLFTAGHWLLWSVITYMALQVPENERHKTADSIPLLARIAMWTHNTGLNINFIVTLLYWFLLFPDDRAQVLMRSFTHGGTFLIMVADSLLSAHKVYVYHVVFPFVFGCAYGVFTVIYWAAGGTDEHGNKAIYDAMDWEDSATSAGILCVILALVVVPLVTSGCAVLSWLARRSSS